MCVCVRGAAGAGRARRKLPSLGADEGGRQVDESEASPAFLRDAGKCCNMFEASDALIMGGWVF